MFWPQSPRLLNDPSSCRHRRRLIPRRCNCYLWPTVTSRWSPFCFGFCYYHDLSFSGNLEFFCLTVGFLGLKWKIEGESALFFIFFLQLIMLLWSYFTVVSKDPGSVPENWRAVLPEEALETGSSLNDRSDCVVATDGLDRRAFCNHCENGKPPRCHHCSVCRPSFLTFKCLVFSMFLVSFCYANILHVLDVSLDVFPCITAILWTAIMS